MPYLVKRKVQRHNVSWSASTNLGKPDRVWQGCHPFIEVAQDLLNALYKWWRVTSTIDCRDNIARNLCELNASDDIVGIRKLCLLFVR